MTSRYQNGIRNLKYRSTIPTFFCLDPLEIHVFSSIFGLSPWNSNDFYYTPLEFSINILNGGGLQFFLLNTDYKSLEES